MKTIKMKKSEINEEIALILGFKKHNPNPKKGVHWTQWEYPDEWVDEICAVPVHSIPDFVELIEQSRQVAKLYRYGIPKERFLDQ